MAHRSRTYHQHFIFLIIARDNKTYCAIKLELSRDKIDWKACASVSVEARDLLCCGSDHGRSAWIVCDNKGYPFGLVCLRSVFGIRSDCFGTCDVVNTSYLLVKERRVVSPFVKISFEFSSAFCESVVRRTNTAESIKS